MSWFRRPDASGPPVATEWEFRKEIICPRDRKSRKRFGEYREYYRVKYDLARRFNPRSILEIGVRAGYSAHTFLSACPTARYTGIDAENLQHGGQGGPWMWWAERILEGFDVTLIKADSQTLDRIEGTFDFIHIDGDHTTEGLLHDLEICWPAMNDGGVILVDDYDYIETVTAGCDLWAQRPDVNREYVESLRGEILFTRRDVTSHG